MSASLILNRRNFLRTSLAGASAAAFGVDPAEAQRRSETLLVVQELGPNSLDMQGVGSNQTVNGLSWNCYDRLLSYAAKTLPDGTLSYDREKLAPRLAESWEVAADGMSCTFRLRKGATFHDGSPVTAKDVKWSFDRAVKVGGFPTFQMSAGSLEKPEQFVVVDDHTFRIDYVRKDKMLLFNVAVVVPFIINSELARRTPPEDPWAMALAEEQRGRRRRLPDRKLEARHRNHLRPLRQLEQRAAAEAQAHHQRATSPSGVRGVRCWSGAMPISQAVLRRVTSIRS
jgi:peptide/nickel transport system substrate-binding protein